MDACQPIKSAEINTSQRPKGDPGKRRGSSSSRNSQTAKDYIDSQLQLEADAREALPYTFDSCTQPMGPLRQILFACMTCNPPPTSPDDKYAPAAVCYSCSISCHGEHTLVELFSRRNFVCDCGTTRLPVSAPCTLRNNPTTGLRGVHSEAPALDNTYNHNFQNRFCGCGEVYNAFTEKGTMFQCLGLGTVETGGCGEDWWHPECLIGLPRDWNKAEAGNKRPDADNEAANGSMEAGHDDDDNDEDDNEEETPLPAGFPDEDDFDAFICFKCVDSNPWLKRYAGTPGFLPPVYRNGGLAESLARERPQAFESLVPQQDGIKRRRSTGSGEGVPAPKRAKDGRVSGGASTKVESLDTGGDQPGSKHQLLPASGPAGSFSIFVKRDFRDRFCRCPECYPNLAPHPQLCEEEEAYEPPLSEGGEANDGASAGTSLLDRGEAALSAMDRVQAIEGVMAYNRLRDNLREFLKPYAESGKAVSAEDIKAYFEALRGDDQAIKYAAGQASAASNAHDKGDGCGDGDNRHEQSGY